MDVSAPSATLGSTCSSCGYPRAGLPSEARCPECGAPPPVPVTPLLIPSATPADRSQQAWLVTVTIGLLLLIVCSFFALVSELYINNGGLTLVIINAPAPKLMAGATLLREVGNPGPWGVQGFLAAIGTLLAVWLITERHASMRDEPAVNLRRATRVVSLLCFGALYGGLTSGFSIEVTGWVWYTLPSTLCAVAAVELPANTLLYLYLAGLSKRFDPAIDPRPRFGLVRAAWLSAITCAAGCVISILRYRAQDEPVMTWRWIQCGFGVLALASGLFMTMAVLRLTARMLAASIDASVTSIPQAIRTLTPMLGRLVARVRADPIRYALVAGLLIWMYFTRPLLEMTAWMDHRRGVGGDLPAFNFIGPKVSAVPLIDVSDSYYSSIRADARFTVLSILAVVWLLTLYRPIRRWPPRLLVRWYPTLSLAAALSLMVILERVLEHLRQSWWTAAAIVFIEAPGTLLVYGFLSNIAESIAAQPLARHLRSVGRVATLIILFPLVYHATSRFLLPVKNLPVLLVVSVIYGMLVIVSSIIAWALLVRLVWSLLADRDLADRPAVAGPA